MSDALDRRPGEIRLAPVVNCGLCPHTQTLAACFTEPAQQEKELITDGWERTKDHGWICGSCSVWHHYECADC